MKRDQDTVTEYQKRPNMYQALLKKLPPTTFRTRSHAIAYYEFFLQLGKK